MGERQQVVEEVDDGGVESYAALLQEECETLETRHLYEEQSVYPVERQTGPVTKTGDTEPLQTEMMRDIRRASFVFSIFIFSYFYIFFMIFYCSGPPSYRLR